MKILYFDSSPEDCCVVRDNLMVDGHLVLTHLEIRGAFVASMIDIPDLILCGPSMNARELSQAIAQQPDKRLQAVKLVVITEEPIQGDCKPDRFIRITRGTFPSPASIIRNRVCAMSV